MSIRFKLSAMILFCSLLMIAIGLIGLVGIKKSNDTLQSVFNVNMKNVVLLSKINGDMRANRIQMLLALQHDPSNEFSKLHDHSTGTHIDVVKKNSEEISALFGEFMTKRKEDGQTRELADRFSADLAAYEKDGLQAAAAAVLHGDYHGAYRVTFDVINPAVQKANKSLDTLIEYEQALTKDAYEGALKRYNLLRTVIISGISLALVCAALVAAYLINSISHSSKQLRQTAAQLVDGNLLVRADIRSRDELAEIGVSFNQIADMLQDVVSRARSSADAVTGAAGELRSNAEQIATGAERVATQAMTVATAGEQMAATSNDIAGNCSMAVESSNHACATATQGAATVQKTVEGMARIAGKVQETARTVESLGTRSDQIGAIIGTIEDIADQTNLLALNAAIEAARAGEQGRGFAVVADEVRALAERTTRATREIGDMIKAIQGETRNAVSAMEEGVREVERGTEDAARSGLALEEILTQVSEVTGQINQIATAAEEQTATTNEISTNMQRITQVVQDTAGSSQMTAEAAAHLEALARELQQSVERFRLDR